MFDDEGVTLGRLWEVGVMWVLLSLALWAGARLAVEVEFTTPPEVRAPHAKAYKLLD